MLTCPSKTDPQLYSYQVPEKSTYSGHIGGFAYLRIIVQSGKLDVILDHSYLAAVFLWPEVHVPIGSPIPHYLAVLAGDP
jgi:hypothetical protein